MLKRHFLSLVAIILMAIVFGAFEWSREVGKDSAQSVLPHHINIS
jgi:hypothetical protein